MITLADLIEQVVCNVESLKDTIESVGTFCGFNRPAVFVIHCNREDGEPYDILIRDEEQLDAERR